MRETNRKKGKHTSNVYRNITYSGVERKNTKGRRHKSNKKQSQRLNLKKVFLVILIPIIVIFVITKAFKSDNNKVETSNNNSNMPSKNNVDVNQPVSNEPEVPVSTEPKPKVEITDWRLTLANFDNILPEDFEVELENIDSSRQFDARAIKYLKDMINAMKKAGKTNIWVQSSYRSVERQKELFDNSVNKYLKQGKSQEEAEKLTLEYINKPGGSDHNLGLAVDFNYVDNTFAKTPEYKWLLENAENYGFVLRYPEDKEDITKIEYESWHWRFVGEEHAKRINELNMCLEEYVEYLENGNT